MASKLGLEMAVVNTLIVENQNRHLSLSGNVEDRLVLFIVYVLLFPKKTISLYFFNIFYN